MCASQVAVVFLTWSKKWSRLLKFLVDGQICFNNPNCILCTESAWQKELTTIKSEVLPLVTAQERGSAALEDQSHDSKQHLLPLLAEKLLGRTRRESHHSQHLELPWKSGTCLSGQSGHV